MVVGLVLNLLMRGSERRKFSTLSKQLIRRDLSVPSVPSPTYECTFEESIQGSRAQHRIGLMFVLGWSMHKSVHRWKVARQKARMNHARVDSLP